jgi:hypothetical protein
MNALKAKKKPEFHALLVSILGWIHIGVPGEQKDAKKTKDSK